MIAALVVLLVCATTTPAAAQAGLAGIVFDPSGYVVAHVPIVFVDQNTGHRATATSGPYGHYYVSELPAGLYSVTVDVKLPADKLPFTYRKVDFKVLDAHLNALDIRLSFVTEERVIVAEKPAPTSIETSIDGTTRFSRAAIDAMPLTNGRTLQSMLSVVPGILVTESNGSLAQFTAVGQRRHANRLTIDGVSGDLAVAVSVPGIDEGESGVLPAFAVSGGTQTLIPIAAIEEIEVRTTNATPEHARSPGAQTAIVTRSGADRLSASAFVEGRPSGLAATDWFENAGLSPVRKTNFWDTGVSVGGPILPGRIFYFGTWQGQRIDRTMFATTPVPSQAVREVASEELRPLLDAYPQPNGQELEEGLAEFTHAIPAPTRLSALSLRFDANLSRQHRLFARLHGGGSTGDSLAAGGPMPATTSFTRTESTSTRTATLGLTSSSSSMTHELRVNVSSHRGSLVDSGASYGGAGEVPFGLLLPPAVPQENAYVGAVLFAGAGGIVSSGPWMTSRQRQFEIADSWSRVRGRHYWRLGFDYRQLTLSSTASADRYVYRFNDLAQLLDGRATSVSVEQIRPVEVRLHRWSLFVQDTLRLSPRLTMDYGLRYGVAPPPSSLTDIEPILLDYDTLPQMPQVPPQPRPPGSRLWKTSWADFQPHVAATYQLGTAERYEASLRASWRLVLDDRTSDAMSAFGGGAPYVSRRIFRPSAFPVPQAELAFMPPPLAAGNLADHYSVPEDLRAPKTYDWQVSLDQSVGHKRRVGLTYAGAAGRHLIYQSAYWRDPSRPPSARVYASSNDGRSDYHALLAVYTQRLPRGTQARVSYTWSHAIDVDSGELTVGGPAAPPIRIPPRSNSGSADYDRRHAFHASVSYRVQAARLPKLLRMLSEDLQLDVVGVARSGGPLTVLTSRDIGFGLYGFRADVVADVPLWIEDSMSPGGRRLNPAAFSPPVGPVQGSLARNALRASPLRQIDLSLSRSLRLGSRSVVQLRVDAFNVFNIPNFGPPYSVLGLDQFGQFYESYSDALGTGTLTRGGLVPIQQLGGPRSLQLGVRFSY